MYRTRLGFGEIIKWHLKYRGKSKDMDNIQLNIITMCKFLKSLMINFCTFEKITILCRVYFQQNYDGNKI